MAAVARLESVSVDFGRRRVLDDVSMEVPGGSVTVLVGPSGSGKTTLLRCLNRLNELYPGHRAAGRVELRIDGNTFEVRDGTVDVTTLRRRVAMVFQAPNALPVSIRRNLLLPLRLVLGVRGDEAEARMRAALEEAGLWDEVADRLDASALRLSGGQQQRLCLARALVLDPAVLLLDEPTASLDFRAARKIEALIQRLGERYTVLAVSHGLEQAARLADQAVVLGDGRVLARLEGPDVADPARFRRSVEAHF